jgi:hypothetical protein
MNRKLVWLVWAMTALLTIWVFLYALGFYFGDVGRLGGDIARAG